MADLGAIGRSLSAQLQGFTAFSSCSGRPVLPHEDDETLVASPAADQVGGLGFLSVRFSVPGGPAGGVVDTLFGTVQQGGRICSTRESSKKAAPNAGSPA